MATRRYVNCFWLSLIPCCALWTMVMICFAPKFFEINFKVSSHSSLSDNKDFHVVDAETVLSNSVLKKEPDKYVIYSTSHYIVSYFYKPDIELSLIEHPEILVGGEKVKIYDADHIVWNSSSLMDQLTVPKTKCRRLVSFGGHISCGAKDGNKYICLDPDVAPIAKLSLGIEQQRRKKRINTRITSELNLNACDTYSDRSLSVEIVTKEPDSRDPCLIHSFGISNDTTFDEAVALFGCKSFAYDMTIENITQQIGPNLNFVNFGLSNVSSDLMYLTTYPSNTRVIISVRTLDDIKRIFDQEARTIDVLKMDIEYAEWKVFDYLFRTEETRKVLNSVNQIAVEIHLNGLMFESEAMRVHYGKLYEQTFANLSQLGFKLAFSFSNQISQAYADVRGLTFPLFRESLFIRRL